MFRDKNKSLTIKGTMKCLRNLDDVYISLHVMYNVYNKSFIQTLFFCNPNGYSGPSTVEFQFSCTACQAVDTQFFFRVETEAVGVSNCV